MSKKKKVRNIYEKVMTDSERLMVISENMIEMEKRRDIMVFASMSKELAKRILRITSQLETIFKL